MIAIKPFQPQQQRQVAELIVQIQQAEFGVPVSRADQADLLDIAEVYQRDRGNFWVAHDGERLIGSLGLLDIGGEHGVLRKIFVQREYRGEKHRVAFKLLQALLAWARFSGVRRLYFGSTAQFMAAHRFYEKHDFSLIAREQLPTGFPARPVDTHFYQRRLG